jgi:predicted acyl esterase
MPTWENFVNHPNYDQFWQNQALINQIKKTRVPIMHVAGWWDQEDFYGPIKAYEILEKTDTNDMNHLVVGPWNHGGWNGATGDKLGSVDFGAPVSKDFRANILRPWFAYYLKNKGKLTQPEATTFETARIAGPPMISGRRRKVSHLANLFPIEQTAFVQQTHRLGRTIR